MSNRRPIARQGASSPSLRDLMRDIVQGGFARGAGGALLASALLLALAVVSWSVRDPSLNHASDGPVRNWLGHPGAIVSDVMIQLFGVAILALFAIMVALGAALLRRRRPDRLLARVACGLIGLFAAAGFASLLPRADSWPLPTGLGGAMGDAVERLPLLLLGTAGWAKALAALLLAGVAILTMHGAMARRPIFADADDFEDDAAPRRADVDDDRDDEPGKALLLIGALVHGGRSLAAGVRRTVRSFKAGPGHAIASGARRMVENVTAEDQAAYAMAGGPANSGFERREPVLTRRAEPAAQPAPRMAQPTPELSAPVYSRVRAAEPAAPFPVAPPPVAAPAATPVSQPGYMTAVSALQQAAKRRLGLLREAAPEAPPAPAAPPAASEAAFRPGEQAAIAALQAAARKRLEGGRSEDRLMDAAPVDVADAARMVMRRSASLDDLADDDADEIPAPKPSRVTAPAPQPIRAGKRIQREAQPDLLGRDAYELPPITLLNEPKRGATVAISEDALEQNARLLEGVLEDFGVRGEIINVRPGPVVTLYELEPAPGTKSSRVIGLADDIARSMSAISARVAVVPGRNAIGIELPNQRRETVYFRELIGSQDFEKSNLKLAMALGKTIGGEAVIAELAKMPHLLVAGTTGSGKSVAINTMIMSLLYRLTPEQCRLIMIDPKMLELSVYDGIPHLLTPVVTDPKKAVVALKWAVREMEDRYKKMSKLGVRNIDGFNARVAEARATGEVITRSVQTGFDRETGEIIEETAEMPLDQLPYIVVIIDEMADLMMVAGKDIEGAVQRLAQMARAAGIHVIMATQRPSVDVITGTIKANFPTRISFQVTSKIDSRTILGEMGAEQLLGQGDMLHMAGGGRISRVHGPFVSDEEVERIVQHLKRQGKPQYLDAITRDEEEGAGEEDAGAVFDKGEFGAEEGGDLYDQAVKVVLRDRKASTSYIQRRLQIGYNRAASLMERMEKEGVVGQANHAGKREILIEGEE
jgi:S-DNA-T family DNA segregation ATPase FtsK/SpoIIIE